MPLTPGQQAWMKDQLNGKRAVVVDGEVTKVVPDTPTFNIVTVSSPIGQASFRTRAVPEVGDDATVRLEGTVSDVVMEPTPMLVVTGPNGQARLPVEPPRSEAEEDAFQQELAETRAKLDQEAQAALAAAEERRLEAVRQRAVRRDELKKIAAGSNIGAMRTALNSLIQEMYEPPAPGPAPAPAPGPTPRPR